MSSSKRTVHYVASTHWDREWYQSFQDYRFRLVKLIDELIDHMKRDDDFRYFQMDGQSIPIEDYLEVRPERENEMRELVESGRIRLGPWYVLPDEWLVSGESIIRNFRMGLSVAARYGRPSRVGFLCDMFGHISQMPQILRGFAIDNALLWRGLNRPQGELLKWRSPDGSEVLTYRFPTPRGYCSYPLDVRHSENPDQRFEVDDALQGLKAHVDSEAKRCPNPSLMLFDGADHTEIEPLTSELLKRANETMPNYEFIHSHLDGYIEDLREQRDSIQTVYEGEMREPTEMGDEGWFISGTLASRIHLKQQNAACENNLCLWAEPLATFAAACGQAYPHGYLEVAWRYLLQNQPHDSICGCSIDQVHKDMEYRYDQCRMITDLVTQDSIRFLADRIKIPDVGEKDFAAVIFNPTSEPLEGPIDITLRFPADTDMKYQEFFFFEDKMGFRLFDPDGNEIPYQYVNWRPSRMGFRRPYRKLPAADPRHEVDISLQAHVPAHGYTTLLVKPVREPTRYLGSMVVDDHTIENEQLRVSVNPNGTLTLTDKRSGNVFDRLLTLQDQEDIGDGWWHGPAVNTGLYSSTGAHADIAIIADGIHKATLKIRVHMNVPERFDFNEMVRTERHQPIEVSHTVTLRRDSDAIEVHTTVDNTVRDHRLRVFFPSDAKADTYLADGTFDVLERNIALREDNARYKELEVETKPQYTWTAVHDQNRGLAVITTGLPESTVRDTEDRPIALTLLRGFIKAVLTSGNEGGEIQGRYEFDYRIVPLAGKPDVSRLSRTGQQLAAGVRCTQIEPRDYLSFQPSEIPERSLPLRQSMLEIEAGEAIVSAIHQVSHDERASIRVFNPTGQRTKAKLSLAGTTQQAQLTDLEGKAHDDLAVRDNRVEVEIKPKQILTVRLS